MSDFSDLRKKLLFWLSLKAILLTFFIFFSPIGLGPDEAQYWTWSQVLDWGYYSKPPGIAWQIAAGTAIFGSTEWGIRSTALLIGFFLSLALFELARKAGLKPYTAFWSALFLAVSPIGILGSFLATTDGGLLLSWIIGLTILFSALEKKGEPNFFAFGFVVAIGSLFKWTIFFLWPFYILALFLYSEKINKISFLGGVLLSFTGLLPSIWWNINHEWATFKHVSSTLQGGNQERITGNFWEFLGSQTLLISLVFFVFLIWSFVVVYKKRKEIAPPLIFSVIITGTLLFFASIASLFQKIQGNWIVFAYPTGFLLISWLLVEEKIFSFKWVKIGISCSLLITLLPLFIPFLYTPYFQSFAPSFRYHPLKHNTGWNVLEKTLKEIGYDPKHHFLMSDKYQTTSLLSFYSEEKKRAYFLNLTGIRKNQFSYWPDLKNREKGKEGYFVWVENLPYLAKDQEEKRYFYQKELSNYFEKVEYIACLPLVRDQDGKIGKAVMFFRCKNCTNLPDETQNLSY